MTTSAEPLPASTKLALERTRLAHERTLMAWVRTATSLISFGFTFYKFFQYLHEGRQVIEGQFLNPRNFALLMIGIGLTALTLATVEHRRNLHTLRVDYGPVPVSLAAVVAALIAVVGVLGLVTVWLQQ